MIPGSRNESPRAHQRSVNPTLQYHHGEWEIARDPAHPNHALPHVGPEHRRILDIGCGMGQSLMALPLSSAAEAWGIDPDVDALAAGTRLVPHNIHLIAGAGEDLPFPDCSFDLVFSRVALPYMDISKVITEAARVLRPGGAFWAMLHPPGMLMRRIGDDIRSGRMKDLAFCGCIGANSLMLHLLGRQFRIGGSRETVQTASGMRRLLIAGGLHPYLVHRAPHLIVQAYKS